MKNLISNLPWNKKLKILRILKGGLKQRHQVGVVLIRRYIGIGRTGKIILE